MKKNGSVNEGKLKFHSLHTRFEYFVFPDDSVITQCNLYNGDGDYSKLPVATGYSICHQTDKFSGILGRQKAIGRAISAWERNQSHEVCLAASSIAAEAMLFVPLSLYRKVLPDLPFADKTDILGLGSKEEKECVTSQNSK
jgi:hypothetical protein